MLACWRMGAIALPCNTQLRRHDLELRVRAANVVLCVAEEELLGELPDGVPVMTMSEVAEVMDEERPQEPPVEPADLDPARGRPDRVHLRDDRRAARSPAPPALPGGPAGPGRALARGAGGRARLVHHGARLGEVGAQRVRRSLALRGRGADSRRPLRPGRAPGADRARERQRALPGTDRVQDARRARSASAPSLPAAHGLGRRASQPGGDRGLPGGDSASTSATATARPRPGT